MSSSLSKQFIWGCATSAYQIEGAAKEDGRGPSIWDIFCQTDGNVTDGSNANIACDHYHRYRDDVALIKNLGTQAYRFSVSWPRLIPGGVGKVNAEGVAFYDRLIDELLHAGVQPWLTMYHWDLPQALQEQGGWANREIADWFRDFALLIADRFGDRVEHFIVLNEATMTSHRGHAYGTDAPGIQDRSAFFATIHHQNLAQGEALKALRASSSDWQLGTALLLQPAVTQSSLAADQAAASLMDATWNRSFLNPLILGSYPPAIAADIAPWLQSGDLEIVQQPVDFLGVNYYVRNHVAAGSDGILNVERVPPPCEVPKTPGGGLEIYPQGLRDVLIDLKDHYGNPVVYVTESGCQALSEPVNEGGQVVDDYRIDYLQQHIDAVRQANEEGADVRGFFVWSLLDNFEWAHGYGPRYGLVHVDYDTLERAPKASYDWYANLIRQYATSS